MRRVITAILPLEPFPTGPRVRVTAIDVVGREGDEQYSHEYHFTVTGDDEVRAVINEAGFEPDRNAIAS